ncbi:MAG TPA: ATP synthase F1 subunit epsilon [Candidatus Paceibacterota bacterium]|nr:ATP synthase F1 subunit epsilon [Candidatus Paceibacterota bacterium]
MKLYIYSLESIVYEGEADVITLPTLEGEISVLENHIPLVSELRDGSVVIKNKNQREEFPISGGFAEIKPRKTILLVE